mmetsp:Transcript_11265/g.40678  ORF Transcript_11265/g.40678 Transcript_11265/m.40678 type:complete len:200 (-) Transcript_11265:165-764(-)
MIAFGRPSATTTSTRRVKWERIKHVRVYRPIKTFTLPVCWNAYCVPIIAGKVSFIKPLWHRERCSREVKSPLTVQDHVAWEKRCRASCRPKMKGRLDIGKRIEGHVPCPFAAADYLRVFPVIYPLQDTTSREWQCNSMSCINKNTSNERVCMPCFVRRSRSYSRTSVERKVVEPIGQTREKRSPTRAPSPKSVKRIYVW